MKNTLFIFVLFISQIVFGQWNNTEKEQYAKNAQIILNQAVELKDFVGAASGVAQKGKLIWKGGAGWSDRKNNIPADGNMLHRTASIAKPMTAVAILQLVEKEKIDLDVPIQTYLPEFPVKPEGDITTRHLLYNISGIKPYKNNMEGMPKKHYPTLLDAIATFQDRDLAFEPGTDYLYTTYGYVVLGAIIEKVSEQNYGDYMQENIWSKVNMKNTSLEIKGQEYANKAKLYHKLKNKFLSAPNTNLSLKYPGGGIQSTVEDLLNFGHAILNNELISAETFEMMITDSGKKKQGNPYGMGWFLYGEHPEYGRLIGHSGSQSGTSTQLMILLDQGIVAATLSNTSGVWGEVFHVNKSIYELAADKTKLHQAVPQVKELSTAMLKRYEGQYKFEDGKIVTIVQKGNHLLSRAEDRPDFPMYPTSEERFFFRNMNAVYEFELNDKSEVVRAVFKAGEKTIPAQKVK